MKKTIVIGLLSPIVDMGKRSTRWERWRPTVALFQHDDLLVDRFDLLYQTKFTSLLNRIVQDTTHVSPKQKLFPMRLNSKIHGTSSKSTPLCMISLKPIRLIRIQKNI